MGDIFNGTASAISEATYSGEDTNGNIVTDAPVKLLYIDGKLVWHEHTYGSWTTVTDATCTTAGSKRRNCAITGCGVSDTQTIAALGHKYLVTIIDPTCTEQGYTLHECTRDGCSYSYKDSYFDIDSTNHSYGSPTYTWSGNTSCTATRTCKNNSSHTETATATITSKVTTAATCTTEGVKTYTATFSESWATAQTKTVTIPATGHSYGLPMYVWNGYTSCTATRNCSKDSSHKETATATITSKVTTLATCTTAGVRTYTATFSESWASNQTKTETIAATGHSWNTPTYSWNGTSSCTATRTCKNNSSHKETATATITSAVTTAATTASAGVRTYTATFSESWAATQTKTETIAKLPALTYELDGDGYIVYATDKYVSGAINIPASYNGKSVKGIGDSAFLGCTEITSVSIYGGTYIDTSAFEGCTKLKTVSINTDGITEIASYAFSGCSSLETVNIPSSVGLIGEQAFSGCSALTSATFGYKYWRGVGSSTNYFGISNTGTGAYFLRSQWVTCTWYKFYAPVINVTLANSTAVSVAIQNKNAVALTASVKTLFDGVTRTTSISVPKNGTATATLTSSSTFDNAETTVYFTALASVTSEMQCQGTGAPKKLTAPVITYAGIEDGYVDFEVQNNNSVDVTYYWSIYDDDGTEVGSGTSTIGAEDADTQSRTVTSSLVYPLEISVYFEADGYKDSNEVFAYVDVQ